MTELDDLYSQLDEVRPQSCCSGLSLDDCYTPVYVGPSYPGSKKKILIVSLQSKTSVSHWVPEPTTKRWSERLFEEWHGSKPEPRNRHIPGCIWQSAILPQLDCETLCGSCCSGKEPEVCALANFAQTNAVKCVQAKENPEFKDKHLIQRCMKQNLFREIEVLKPDAILLQGHDNHRGFLKEIKEQEYGHLEMRSDNVAAVKWNFPRWTGRSVVAFLKHPSALGWALTQQSRDSENEILSRARRVLDERRR